MLNQDGTKTCPRCGETKPAEGNFYRINRRRPDGTQIGDGFHGYCKPCIKGAVVSWQKANPEKKSAQDKKTRDQAYARDHAELDVLKKCARCGFEGNVLEHFGLERRAKSDGTFQHRPKSYCKRCATEMAAAWRKANPDRHYAGVRRWILKNREQQRAWQDKYKTDDPVRRRAQNQCSNNHQRAKKLGRQSAFRYEDWLRALEVFSHRCAFCGADGAGLLDLEHLVPLTRGGDNLSGNVVPACRPCNANKGNLTAEEFCAERRLNSTELRERAKLLTRAA